MTPHWSIAEFYSNYSHIIVTSHYMSHYTSVLFSKAVSQSVIGYLFGKPRLPERHLPIVNF